MDRLTVAICVDVYIAHIPDGTSTCDLRTAAFALAIKRVARATELRGVG